MLLVQKSGPRYRQYVGMLNQVERAVKYESAHQCIARKVIGALSFKSALQLQSGFQYVPTERRKEMKVCQYPLTIISSIAKNHCIYHRCLDTSKYHNVYLIPATCDYIRLQDLPRALLLR